MRMFVILVGCNLIITMGIGGLEGVGGEFSYSRLDKRTCRPRPTMSIYDRKAERMRGMDTIPS